MKKVGDLMSEMGFRAEAPDSLKEAFVRHLIKAATGLAVEPGPHEKKELLREKKEPVQLSFDFASLKSSTKDSA